MKIGYGMTWDEGHGGRKWSSVARGKREQGREVVMWTEMVGLGEGIQTKGVIQTSGDDSRRDTGKEGRQRVEHVLRHSGR